MEGLVITSTVLAVLLLLALAALIAGVWKVFEKAGESGWKSIIPFYNYYIMLRISGHSGWWLLVILLPVLPSILSTLVGVASAQTTMPNMPMGGTVDLGTLIGLGALGFLMFFITIIIFQTVVVVQAVVMYDIARAFGKGLGFTIGMAALPFVFWPILGFSDAEYRGPVAHPKLARAANDSHTDEAA